MIRRICLAHSPLLAAGFVLGALASSLAPACIIPDYCIVVQVNGNDWCMNVEDARMWPIGQPELAEVVSAAKGGPPIGCRCFNDGEVVMLDQQAPAEYYAGLVESLESSARLACANAVPPGYDHDCFIEGPSGPTLTAPYFGGESDDCIGSCGYANPPPFGSCGDDPNPWECNENGDGETGASDTSGGSDTGSDAGSDTGSDEPGVAPGAEVSRRIIQ